MMSKAQGLSMQTVVVAALVLIVLIILVVVFSGKMNFFGKGTEECGSKGGQCQDRACLPGEVPVIAACPDTENCCIPI